MNNQLGREVELASDRFLARERMSIFLGQQMPQTIVMKEIIDNEIDIVGETGQKADKAIIMLSPNRLKVMDNGLGISTEIKEDSDKPSIWYACAKMFSSSNYSNNSMDTIGANGVGMTLANYTSKKFTILNFNGQYVKGYSFTDGFLNGSEESEIKENGDFVQNPLLYEEAVETFSPMLASGFLIDVTWNSCPNELFQDNTDINWLINYAKIRTAEMKTGEIEVLIFSDDSFENQIDRFIWNKNKDSAYYLQSWEEKVKEASASLIKSGPWTFAFGIKDFRIDSICQSAPIKSRYSHGIQIEIQDYNVSVNVPFSMKYLSNEYPSYTDQTKVAVRFPYNIVSKCFEKSGEIYRHFYREAEKSYMAKVIKDSDSGMFWPCLGPSENGELIIAEGYSAISGLKSQRDPKTQACIALRGKILNCWNLDMVKAMRSDIVKQMLNAVIYNNYKKVIIAVDADDDGGHIASLLIGLFARFTNIIQDDKLYYVHTPYYLFKKGKDLKWSDNAADCPKGYHTTTLKGLGGMTSSEIRTFIMNEETRNLIKINWDNEAEKSLDHAFSEGGQNWIIY